MLPHACGIAAWAICPPNACFGQPSCVDVVEAYGGRHNKANLRPLKQSAVAAGARPHYQYVSVAHIACRDVGPAFVHGFSQFFRLSLYKRNGVVNDKFQCDR